MKHHTYPRVRGHRSERYRLDVSAEAGKVSLHPLNEGHDDRSIGSWAAARGLWRNNPLHIEGVSSVNHCRWGRGLTSRRWGCGLRRWRRSGRRRSSWWRRGHWRRSSWGRRGSRCRATGDVLNGGQLPGSTTTAPTTVAGGVQAIGTQVCTARGGHSTQLGRVGVNGVDQRVSGAGVANNQIHVILQHTVSPSLQRSKARESMSITAEVERARA